MYDIRILKAIKSIIKGLQLNGFFPPHLVDFLYSFNLEFVASSAGKMCRKLKCKETC
jgi:hypothetical protein